MEIDRFNGQLSPVNRWVIIVVTALLSIPMIAALLVGLTHKPESLSKIERGELHLTGSDYLPVRLEGEWAFYWRELLTPGELYETEMFISIPSRWNRVAKGEKSYPGRGHATFSLTIEIPEKRGDLGLKLPNLYRSASVWVNGKQSASIGVPGESLDTEKPSDSLVFVKLPEDKRFDILVQVSSYHHIDGGIPKPPILDTWDNLQAQERLRFAIGLALFFSSLTLWLFLMLLLASSGMDRSLFYLSVTFFGAGIRIFSIEKLILYWYPDVSMEWMLKTEYIGMFITVSAYLMFLQRLFPEQIQRGPMLWHWRLGLLCSVITLFVPAYIYPHMRDPWSLITMLCISYLLICMAKVVYSRERDSMQVGMLGIVFALMIINEVAYYQRWTEFRMTYWGYVVISVTSVFFMGARIRMLFVAAATRSEELQGAVDHRTVELHNRLKDLEEARTQAQEASLRKSELMAIMSHEIRTPLSGLIGSVKLLEQAQLTGLEENLRNNAQQSGEFLLEIVNELLDFSRWETEEQALKPQRFDVQKWLLSIEMLMEVPAREKGIQFTAECCNLPEGEFWLYGDQQKLRQAVINLAHNAIKFTHRGWVSITIRYGGSQLMVTVEDTGIGISPSDKESIFESFVQLDAGVDPAYHGAGLGLAITRRIVARMAGSISLESEEGFGSRFAITVPMGQVDAPFENRSGGPSGRPDTFTSPSIPLRVLLVEDDPANALYVGELIKRSGHTCVTVDSGHKALEEIKEHHFDAFILDISLPDINGVELMGDIKSRFQNTHKADCIFIALTGNINSRELAHGQSDGFHHILQKPIGIETLEGVLKVNVPNRDVELSRKSSMLRDTIELIGSRGVMALLKAAEESAEQSFNMFDIAMSQQSSDGISMAAHRLRSAALTIRLVDVSDMAGAIENRKACDSNDLSQLRQRWEQGLFQLSQEFEEHLSSEAVCF